MRCVRSSGKSAAKIQPLHTIVRGMRARMVATKATHDQNEQPVDGVTGVESLKLRQFQFIAHAVGAEVKQDESRIDRCEPEIIDREQIGKLRPGHPHMVRCVAEDKAGDADVKKKFQRIDIKQNDEEQHAGEKARPAVVESVTAAEFVMAVPNEREEEKAERERRKAAHRFKEIADCLWNIERDHEQGERKTENGVAESFETTDLEAALTKAIGHFTIVFGASGAEHGARYSNPRARNVSST